MAAGERIPVQPDVLRWARTSAGYSETDGANALGVSPATLSKWENGDLSPTIVQLRNIGKRFGRPLAVLLLPTPPLDYSTPRDFRRASAQSSFSPHALAEFRRAESQRDIFVELAEISQSLDVPDSTPPRITLQTDPEIAAQSLREWLLAGSLTRNPPVDRYKYLNWWVHAVEGQGILVIHTRNVGVDELRGFSLSSSPFPVIALNGSDFPRGRAFTLLHELTHLALNLGGVCDLHESRQRVGQSDRLEHYCNLVAAAILMPEAQIRSLEAVRSNPNRVWDADNLFEVSQSFGPSSESLLIRLISLDLATWEDYRRIKPEIDLKVKEAVDAEKAKRKAAEKPSGPSYYTVKARDLGKNYVGVVVDALRGRSISSLDAADYLEVRYDQIPKLIAAAGS